MAYITHKNNPHLKIRLENIDHTLLRSGKDFNYIFNAITKFNNPFNNLKLLKLEEKKQ